MAGRLEALGGWPKSLFANRWPQWLAVALLVLLCWLIAGWVWYFLSPRISRVAVAQAPAQTAAFNAGAVAHLFGTPSGGGAPASTEVAASTLNVQLKGVFAELGRHPAFAIVNVDGKDEPVEVGAQVMPGITLDRVHGDHVIVRRQGALERITFPESALGGGQATFGRPALPAAGSPQGAAQQQQFRLNVQRQAPNVMSLSRQQLNTALQDTASMDSMGRVSPNAGGGVMVEDVPDGSLAQKLGLQQGDVVRMINGQPVNSPTDLIRLYEEFSDLTQVQVVGVRSGRPLQLTYNVQQ